VPGIARLSEEHKQKESKVKAKEKKQLAVPHSSIVYLLL